MKQKVKPKSKRAKQPKQSTDECSGCGIDIWRCTDCSIPFKKNDAVFCVHNGGNHHLCKKCHAAWLVNGKGVM